MGYQLHLRIRVATKRQANFLAFLARAFPIYEAPGDIRMQLLRDLNDPTSFIEVVHYATREAFDADQIRVKSDPETQKLLAEWRTYLLEPPQVLTYVEQSPGEPVSN